MALVEAKEFGKGLDSKSLDLYRRFGGKRELKNICKAVVMRKLHSCLSLD